MSVLWPGICWLVVLSNGHFIVKAFEAFWPLSISSFEGYETYWRRPANVLIVFICDLVSSPGGRKTKLTCKHWTLVLINKELILITFLHNILVFLVIKDECVSRDTPTTLSTKAELFWQMTSNDMKVCAMRRLRQADKLQWSLICDAIVIFELLLSHLMV